MLILHIITQDDFDEPIDIPEAIKICQATGGFYVAFVDGFAFRSPFDAADFILKVQEAQESKTP